ncbi:MAG: hypothetical protein IH987_20435 [Planctomycetes bacterium]|nr:hypothetical protein [Planctomycetota bacterium]
MMKRSKRKMAALMLAVAMPGSMMFSCSGTWGRELRDSALVGAGQFVADTTFNVLDSWFSIPANEE